jgi:hypothetical protein
MMSDPKTILRDERTTAVENVCSIWSGVFVSFALLVDVVVRGFVYHQAAWDLLALACVPGLASLLYQARHKTLAKGWLSQAMLLAFLAGIVGFAVAFILGMTRAM